MSAFFLVSLLILCSFRFSGPRGFPVVFLAMSYCSGKASFTIFNVQDWCYDSPPPETSDFL